MGKKRDTDFKINLGTAYNGKWFGALMIPHKYERDFDPKYPGITHDDRSWMLNHWICVYRRMSCDKHGRWTVDTTNVKGVCLENGIVKEVIKILELKGQKVYQVCSPAGKILEERAFGRDVVFVDLPKAETSSKEIIRNALGKDVTFRDDPPKKTHRPMKSMDPPIQQITPKTATKVMFEPTQKQKTPGKKSKKDLVLELFNKIGDSSTTEEVIEHSGFDLKNLKTFIAICKNPKKTKPENIKLFQIEGDVMKWIQ